MYQPTGGFIFGGHVPVDDADPEKVGGEWLDYGLLEDDEYAVVGIPQLDGDIAYAGHFCNDGARLAVGADAPSRALRRSIRQYRRASESARNAKHIDVDGLHMITVATRPIAAGEEVLVSYGAKYWRSHQRRRASSFGRVLSSFL